MKRFIGKLTLLAVIFAAIVVAMHICAVLALQDEVDKTYTLPANVKYLFLGSSQLGGSIEENDSLSNRVIWVSETSAPAWCVRLKELNHRKQLGNLDAVIVPYNFIIPMQQDPRVLRWAFYQELPVNIKHIASSPYSPFSLIAFMCSSLRFPFHMAACSKYPKGRPSIRSRPESWRRQNLSQFVESATKMQLGAKCHPDWEIITRQAYEEMASICRENNVRFIIYRQPVLKQYYDAISQELKDYETAELNRYEKLGIEVVRPPHYYNDDLFFDSVHFVDAGTKMFTQIIMGYLRRAK